jgi:hypothetical protein
MTMTGIAIAGATITAAGAAIIATRWSHETFSANATNTLYLA